MKKRSIRLMAILAAGIVLAIFVLRYVFKDNPEDLSAARPKFTLSISQLYSEFESDEAAANEKYVGEVVELYGQLLEKSKDDWGQTLLVFLDPVFGVTATLDSLTSIKQQQLLREIQPGSQIRIKGRCDGMLTDVRISKTWMLE